MTMLHAKGPDTCQMQMCHKPSVTRVTVGEKSKNYCEYHAAARVAQAKSDGAAQQVLTEKLP